ncbi:MAG: DUF2442 domain-containing protein [Candidatus Marinimicrobia bacterium]|nr:DUF2442 domain-containing protein [Candidatus Neomarinimicrobiota bacterium]
MYKDIVSAVYHGQYKIKLTFEDGKTGVVDFHKYLKKGGVFKSFSDLEFFKNFKINTELGVLTWNNNIDIAPEVIYNEATNTPLPSWMDA